ncbi:MAG: hypothetical protein R3E96_12495 [Planctomycetota bacterium]
MGSSFVADNTLTLEAAQLPNFVFGIFITSQTQGLDRANLGGADGNLCLSGAIGRYNQGGRSSASSGSGTGSLVLDLTMTPTPNTPVAVMAGRPGTSRLGTATSTTTPRTRTSRTRFRSRSNEGAWGLPALWNIGRTKDHKEWVYSRRNAGCTPRIT